MNQAEARKYIGGHWEGTGRAQFQFMLDMGLKPESKFLDIGCGCFRGGRFFIPYLNRENYCGIDHIVELLESGFEHEFKEGWGDKLPMFTVNDDFDFTPFQTRFDFALAKSVFTHMPLDKFSTCLNNLKNCMGKDGRLYATFFYGDSARNPKKQDDTRKFAYNKFDIEDTAIEAGWKLLSDTPFSKWEPRSKQMMLEFKLQ